MQILVQNNIILASTDKGNNLDFDPNQNQAVLKTEKYNHNDLMIKNDKFTQMNTLTNLFVITELQEMFGLAISEYFGNLINETYPAYKQMNIIRQAKGYTQNDLTTMTTFIDGNRDLCKSKIAGLNALTNINDVVEYSLYK